MKLCGATNQIIQTYGSVIVFVWSSAKITQFIYIYLSADKFQFPLKLRLTVEL